MEESSEVLFSIFGLKVTSQVTTMWGIMLVLVVISVLATRNLKEKPGKLQNLMEMAVSALKNFFAGLMGEDKAVRYMPLMGTLFIFIICSNYVGILPAAGVVKGFTAPTSSLSTTAALGIIVFFSLHFIGVRTCGLKGYGKHFIKPVAFLLPFLIIDEIVRPVSLALRLYGNIFGEETVTEQLYELFPIGVPVVMMVLSLLFCAIQAVVFTMLTAIYIEEATEPV
ncbi:MAG: F0F1 ATP synthase subunit A [Oscillospiraceae bacterium]|jgi:F-type H+-transporting ATPase subunit a|nr:F0F1 ATP synthase subunit A [Oscillospiraceae bacterium]